MACRIWMVLKARWCLEICLFLYRLDNGFAILSCANNIILGVAECNILYVSSSFNVAIRELNLLALVVCVYTGLHLIA
jgi:hypothetical protein